MAKTQEKRIDELKKEKKELKKQAKLLEKHYKYVNISILLLNLNTSIMKYAIKLSFLQLKKFQNQNLI